MNVKRIVVNFARLPQAFHHSSRDVCTSWRTFHVRCMNQRQTLSPRAYWHSSTALHLRTLQISKTHVATRMALSPDPHHLSLYSCRSTMIHWKPTSAIRLSFNKQGHRSVSFTDTPPTPPENSFLMCSAASSRYKRELDSVGEG